jgi:endonuclease/exonuclease/phosphatase family metal-dependent hydrolase
MIAAVIVILGLLGGLLLAVLLWAGGGKTLHEPHGSGIIEGIPDALERDPVASGTLAVLTYVLAYGLGGQRYSAASLEVATIYDRLDCIVETIAASGADVALLQEVDFASQRTHNIDQLHYIAAALGWGFAARAIAWECRYLPYPVWPAGRAVGRLRAGMGVISRYPLVQNSRQRLSQARPVPMLASLFSPHPTVQMVDVQCGTQTIRLFNVHLDVHDAATRQRQARELTEFVRQVATPASILMGVLHPVARRVSPDSHEPERSPDQAVGIILDALQERFRAVPDDGLPAPALAAPAPVPYLLVGSGVRAVETRVMPPQESISAYSPLLVQLRWALPLVVSNGRSHDERL